MAYPASTKTHAVWVEEIDRRATLLKTSAQEQHSLSLAGGLDMNFIRRFFDVLVSVNTYFGTAEAVTGLAEYLNSQKQGQVADPVAEFDAMQVQVIATLDWLRANVPQAVFGGTAYKLAFTFPVDNVTPSAPLVFTSGQTAAYRTVLTALIATIS